MMKFALFVLLVFGSCKSPIELVSPEPPVNLTVDTTSHDFTWTSDTIGTHIGGSNQLNDVCIVNDTLAYAVGSLYFPDSLGNIDYDLYNVLRWNGKKWQPLRIKFPSYNFNDGSIAFYSSANAIAVFALSANNVLFASGGGVARWNGSSFIQYPRAVENGWATASIRKIWGISENDFYTIGYKGAIYHYKNGVWKQMNSGTTLPMTDIYGTPDGKEIWACAYTDSALASVLLRLDQSSGQWQTLYRYSIYQSPPFVGVFRGYTGSTIRLWASGQDEFLVAGGLIYRHPLAHLQLDSVRQETVPIPNGIDLFRPGAEYIRGSAKNNAAVCGFFETVQHWNGASWRRYDVLDPKERLFGISVSTNLIMAVGTRYDEYFIDQHPLIIIGKR